MSILWTISLAWLSCPQATVELAREHSHVFQGAETCRACHPRHYLEWRGSGHAYSAQNPLVVACNRRALSDTKGAIAALCVNCHVPLGARTGELAKAFEMTGLSKLALEGVSCEICHRMEPSRDGKPIANANFDLAEGSLVHGRLKNPTATAAHESLHGEFIGKSEFCGSCHDVLHGATLFEKSFAQWDASVHKQRGDPCQNCHMLRYSGQAAVGGPFRETLHRHNFPAVTVPLVPFPNKGYQSEEVQEFLRTAARMSVILPPEAPAGGKICFTVLVKNIGAGHNIPTGLANERQMWIEAQVNDASGTTLFQSGLLDLNGDLMDHHSALSPNGDPYLTLFNDRFLDDQGNEVPFLWLAVRVEERSLKPLEERGAAYSANLPDTLEGGKVQVRVRLLFRPFPPYAMRSLGLEDLVKSLPIWEMDSFESEWIPVVKEVARRTNWRVPEDFATIGEAIATLTDGDHVTVGPGEYSLSRPLDFQGKGIRLKSLRGPLATTLRFTATTEAREASVVVFKSGEGRGSTLEGFTIRGGRGTEVNGTRVGGGVYVSRSSPSLISNRIVDCEARGGLGGGIYCDSGSPSLRDNDVSSCGAERGGGIYLTGTAKVHIYSGSVEGSRAEVGAGIYVGTGVDARLERLEIAGNTAAREGGGVFAESDVHLGLHHCTLVHNRAAKGSAAVRAVSGMVERVSNSILCSNVPQGADIELAYCLVDFDVPFGTSQKALPLFTDPSGTWDPLTGRWVPGQYKLLWGSPAIDAGDPEETPDVDDSRSDIGAHYFEQRLKAFVRGDVNGDGKVEVADLLALDGFFRRSGDRVIACFDAADLNDDGQVTPADLAHLMAHFCLNSLPPAPPWPYCGLDPTPGEGLGCWSKGRSCKDS